MNLRGAVARIWGAQVGLVRTTSGAWFDYARAVGSLWTEFGRTASWAGDNPASVARAGARSDASAAAISLEGKVGATLSGAFVVRNELAKRVHARVVVTSVRGGGASEFVPEVVIDPSEFDLSPSDERVVSVFASVTSQWDESQTYLANLEIDGVPRTRISVLLRRR